jgi:tRNA(fMet)-specific endonuclease VapC
MFIFDTDHIGIIQRQTEPEFSRITARMAGHDLRDFCFPIVSFHEQFLGWNAYIGNAKKIEGVIKGYGDLERIIADFNAAQVLPFDRAAADLFLNLKKQRVRVATMDLRIAAIALAQDMTLLSRNLSDFQKVPGLKFEDWTA